LPPTFLVLALPIPAPMRRSLSPLLFLLALPPALGAQVAGRCSVVPDSVLGPTERQVEEAGELRETLAGLLREHGHSAAGLLMVDVDTLRRGKVLFMEADLPEDTRSAVVARVAEYLETLPQGAAYQALVRIDGEYPAIAPGRTHCRPELANGDVLSSTMRRVIELHPEYGRHERQALVRRVVVRMVVTRAGNVALAEVDTPSGDPFIDERASAIAALLRFRPATLDGEAFDVRFRFTLTFRIT
jgi:TonB family protein